MTDRDFQNGFERYNDSLSAHRAWKGVVVDDRRRTALHQYRDLGAEVDA